MKRECAQAQGMGPTILAVRQNGSHHFCCSSERAPSSPHCMLARVSPALLAALPCPQHWRWAPQHTHAPFPRTAPTSARPPPIHTLLSPVSPACILLPMLGNDFVCSLQCILYRFFKHPCNPPLRQLTMNATPHPPTRTQAARGQGLLGDLDALLTPAARERLAGVDVEVRGGGGWGLGWGCKFQLKLNQTNLNERGTVVGAGALG